MKKLLLLVTALTVFALISCSQTSGDSDSDSASDPDVTEVDLRNKNSSGTSVSRTAANNNESIGEYVKTDDDYNYGPLTDADLENLISFEDDEKGFKINYTTPASLREYKLMTRIIYIDNSKHWSTRQNIEMYAINENGHVKDSYSWVYPLVLPGNTYNFAIQFQYSKDGDPNPPDFQLFYRVTPKHGIGIIDDLPEDYNSADYTDFEDGVFSLHDVIPVESEVKLQKSIGLFGTKSSDKYWTGDFKWIDGYDEDITDDPDSATIMDMSERGTVTDYPYVYCQFMYKYCLEGFDGCNFQTPEFVSEIIKNKYFVE